MPNAFYAMPYKFENSGIIVTSSRLLLRTSSCLLPTQRPYFVDSRAQAREVLLPVSFLIYVPQTVKIYRQAH